MVTFPFSEHHRPLASTKLYCLVTEAHMCERLAHSRYVKRNRRESNPRPLDRTSDALTITPPRHTKNTNFLNSVAETKRNFSGVRRLVFAYHMLFGVWGSLSIKDSAKLV